MHYRFVAEPRESVGKLDRMHDAAARIGRVCQDGNPQWPRARDHATASIACRVGLPAPIRSFCAKFHIVSDAVASPMVTRLPPATGPIFAGAMPSFVKRGIVSATFHGLTESK